ncbi:MAG: hypothetical protein A2504_07055 [Bdellovibrionales bacterium RIFOXYD12_FULL_39_22]|nr:MAG: hypothetical protein A2385_05270 [Bdellovibrionales bacterium RIFOXYB1_FULL_39_21]OFZ44333.1 MAG: hypothetical protein A2485_16050 [Bdellovibrionales bacterium RIFOXYC12_FULL_39_17]OFZ49188.1 MAG: hypothetical protein A2404_15990 [Bdellovibrionales bacterium RIFOXYC1_FULL_39_130]OFZ76996.1 MAG: hypothetical protein A2560_11075 [Bdellovibrionales bacterium RIFOXYD1_FULL_39_84]OFZ95209.1 MAG: hypothetical protein A2504_07055 [Bdellovibrionales bacterium RIFOXYD12_FULL_39_22]HLE09638.1 ra
MKYGDIKNLHIELTKNCSLACPSCSRNAPHVFQSFQEITSKRPYGHSLNSEIIFRLISSLPIRFILLCGIQGEPTLHPDFLEIIKFLKSREIAIEIETNGNNHPETWWRDLGSILTKSDTVVFALDGIDQETYSRYRKNGNFNTVLNNHASLKAGSCETVWKFITFGYNVCHLSKAIKLGQHNGFTRFVAHEPWDLFVSEGSDRRKKRTDEFSLDNNLESRLVKALGKRKKFTIECEALDTQGAFIDAFGYVSPCCLAGEYVSEPYSFSKDLDKINIYHYDIMTILNNHYEDFWDRLVKHKIPVCNENCELICKQAKRLHEEKSSIRNY